MKVEINIGQFNSIKKRVVKNIVQQVFESLKKNDIIGREMEIELSVAMVGNEQIKELNNSYRQKNEVTDVLSFCYEKNNNRLEGEIVLAPEIIKENAESDKIEFEEELTKNIIHSILHIIGYDHGDEMFALQNKLIPK